MTANSGFPRRKRAGAGERRDGGPGDRTKPIAVPPTSRRA